VVNGAPQLDCAIQKSNCPGNFLSDTTCLRVPDVRAGEGVVLEGVNFISTDSKVRLTGQAPSTTTREVDAFVFGDLDTPLTEVIDGQARTIRDCRVHDRITFVVPKDLPPAVYSVQVVVPNVSGFPVFGDSIVSNSQFIRISPAPTSRFRVASETLGARQETSPASFGSDEVRVRVRAYPIIASLTALTLGAEQAFDSPEFGDMDSGEIRQMQAVLFDQTGPMDGMVMTIGLRNRQREGLPGSDQLVHRRVPALSQDRAGRHCRVDYRRRVRGRREGSAEVRPLSPDYPRHCRGRGTRGDPDSRGLGAGRSAD
jgi:hypothetical protein